MLCELDSAIEDDWVSIEDIVVEDAAGAQLIRNKDTQSRAMCFVFME